MYTGRATNTSHEAIIRPALFSGPPSPDVWRDVWVVLLSFQPPQWLSFSRLFGNMTATKVMTLIFRHRGKQQSSRSVLPGLCTHQAFSHICRCPRQSIVEKGIQKKKLKKKGNKHLRGIPTRTVTGYDHPVPGGRVQQDAVLGQPAICSGAWEDDPKTQPAVIPGCWGSKATLPTSSLLEERRRWRDMLVMLSWRCPHLVGWARRLRLEVASRVAKRETKGQQGSALEIVHLTRKTVPPSCTRG
jgi:hypothetical protein